MYSESIQKLPDVAMIKKQLLVAPGLLLLAPVVLAAGGFLSNLINPEIAARSLHYHRNYQLLHLLKMSLFLSSLAVAGLLWILACIFLLRSKKQSLLWLPLAVLGPLGIAVFAILNDRAPSPTDPYHRFLGRLNTPLRIAYELCALVLIWVIAYWGMVLNRMMIIWFQAATTGLTTAQIIDIQNASGGMWAFTEGNEVLFLVSLLYLVRPIAFSPIAKAASMLSPQKTT